MNNRQKHYHSRQKYHILYKTTCIITGRFYIGTHSTVNIDDGYLGSGTFLKRSVGKYGPENHNREILEFFDSRPSLMNREKEVVNENLIKDPQCMNLKIGGEGGWPSGKAQMSAETRKKVSDAGHKGFRKKLQDPVWRDNFIKKAQTARKLNDTYHKSGAAEKHIIRMLGNKHRAGTKAPESTKLKMSASHQGETNSQYGTCWVCKDGQNKKICIDVLSLHVEDGWTKGRIIKSKLDPIQKEELIRKHKEGLSERKLANMFNVSRATIVGIINPLKKIWKIQQ